jgi:hypothetical protein
MKLLNKNIPGVRVLIWLFILLMFVAYFIYISLH